VSFLTCHWRIAALPEGYRGVMADSPLDALARTTGGLLASGTRVLGAVLDHDDHQIALWAL
jgi:hypothetical protein